MKDFLVSPVPGTYRTRKVSGPGPGLPLYIQYIVSFADGYDRRFSITRVDNRMFSLVDFDDFRQKDKHYITWDNAYKGMLAICRRICKARGIEVSE